MEKRGAPPIFCSGDDSTNSKLSNLASASLSTLDIYLIEAMTTIILGTGIIGAATAFYLSQSQAPNTIHLVDPSPELFASASGYAGGFVAKNWFGTSVAELGALSFAEHKRLAQEYDGKTKWGYSASTGNSYVPANAKKGGKRGDDWLREGSSRAGAATEVASKLVYNGTEPRWLRRTEGDGVEVISEDGATAQVWVCCCIA